MPSLDLSVTGVVNGADEELFSTLFEDCAELGIDDDGDADLDLYTLDSFLLVY